MDGGKSFEKWKSNIEDLVDRHPLQIISWEATRRCNLSCAHCGSPSENVCLKEELTTEEVINAFDQIARDFDMSQFRHVNITGGEPFVRKDLLTILEEISKQPAYRNIDIQTNGIVLGKKPDLFKQLRDYGVTGIGVSIDGLKGTHDAFRRREGSYDLAFRAAKTAVEEGFTVTVSTVANAKNINEILELYNIVKHEIKPRIFRIMTIDPIGRAQEGNEYLLSPEQTRDVISFLLKEYTSSCEQYHDHSKTMVELGCGGWLGRELEGLVRPFVFHCVAGINNLGILYDGKLAACSNIPRELGFEGDLRIDRIKDVWDNKYQRYRQFEWKRKGDCKNCGEWEYCHGGPMHKRLTDGTMTDCLYQTIANGIDYRS
ncbi:radical SAM protein [Candidatus Woesearchaeota archaeon]|nr:MAG: radical SAM protein [Candidatus Woesearchaeota archaeon]